MDTPMYYGEVMYAEVGEAEGFVSGDKVAVWHHDLTGFAVSAARSIWEKVAA